MGVDSIPSKETPAINLDREDGKYPPNIVSNHRFTPLAFLPFTVGDEFNFWFNLRFLLVALS